MVIKYQSGTDFLAGKATVDWISFLQNPDSHESDHSFSDHRRGGSNRQRLDEYNSISIQFHPARPNQPQPPVIELFFPSSSSLSALQNPQRRLQVKIQGNSLSSSSPSQKSVLKRAVNTINDRARSDETRWRFWKWSQPPPVVKSEDESSPELGRSQDYGAAMARFKDNLHQSVDHLYTTTELKYLASLDLSPMMNYILEDPADFESPLRSYFIFKHGVRPLWEDEYNVAGGCWTLRIVDRDFRHSPRAMWKLVADLLSCEPMRPYLVSGEVSGAGVTIRRHGGGSAGANYYYSYKISVWNRDANNTIAKLEIGQLLKSKLGVYHPTGALYYFAHSTNINNNASAVVAATLKRSRGRRRQSLSSSAAVTRNLSSSSVGSLQQHQQQDLKKRVSFDLEQADLMVVSGGEDVSGYFSSESL